MGVGRSMALDSLRNDIEQKCPEAAVSEVDYEKVGAALEIVAPGPKLVDLAQVMYDASYYLEAITGLDFIDGFQVLYHFNKYLAKERVVIRAKIAKDEKIPSISRIYRAALWHEREVHDFFGIEFDGHPGLRPLLLPEDADFHPLLKDFGKVNAYHRMDEIYGEDK